MRMSKHVRVFANEDVEQLNKELVKFASQEDVEVISVSMSSAYDKTRLCITFVAGIVYEWDEFSAEEPE